MSSGHRFCLFETSGLWRPVWFPYRMSDRKGVREASVKSVGAPLPESTSNLAGAVRQNIHRAAPQDAANTRLRARGDISACYKRDNANTELYNFTCSRRSASAFFKRRKSTPFAADVNVIRDTKSRDRMCLEWRCDLVRVKEEMDE